MGRILCVLRRHQWSAVKTDEAGPYQTCDRCQKVKGSGPLGPGGYDSMPPQVVAGGQN
jgi:hypothetical protein